MINTFSLSPNPNVTSLFMQIKQNFLTATELKKVQELYEGFNKGLSLESFEYNYLLDLRDVTVERFRAAISSHVNCKAFIDDFGCRHSYDA